MYICICKNITDHQIRNAVLEHRVSSMRELRTCLGACDQCGKCAVEARQIIRESTRERRSAETASAKAA